jgi:hypothetical protein
MEEIFMRALCGAIVTAGALIGLGLAALGIGTRYQSFADVDREGNVHYLKFAAMDTPLILILTLLVISLIVGMGIAFIGLAYHHHRRHHEMLHRGHLADPASRVGV